ncbi:MAG TPA: GspH/FimT family pseudopilin [Ideonella sp.]|uniref:GspH/FimT family pseudopilin n=1 Tax=Ideonella sp. TaxID=1929293 RepID=UPI002E31FFD2|nr:GspH/FimT family pseudopilin [Ideonella sp.]HEX5686457.1 GspH/FimT family pseudopilin [Ideonella sp.]
MDPSHQTVRGAQAGFTLVELLITIAIAAILLAIAAPSLTSFLADQAAAGNADEFAAAVRYSRTEAIKRGRVVTMCASADPGADAPECDEDGSWVTGWVITVPPNSTVLRVQNALRAMDGTSTADATSLTFAANGLATVGAGKYTFVPVGGDVTKQRVVRVLSTGRVRVCKGEGDCE